jgi:hypothetical protein
MHILRLIAFLCVVALALSIAGGILGTQVNPDVNTGMILRRVAAGVYAGAYVLTVISWFVFLPHRRIMRRYRRTVREHCLLLCDVTNTPNFDSCSLQFLLPCFSWVCESRTGFSQHGPRPIHSTAIFPQIPLWLGLAHSLAPSGGCTSLWASSWNSAAR